MRQRVTVQRNATAGDDGDDYGQPLDGWEDVATVWAAVVPLEGHETPIANQTQAQATHTVTMRYRASQGPSPGMRIAYRGRTLNILSVLNLDERRRELKILARENVAP